jgi:hypothetical protein
MLEPFCPAYLPALGAGLPSRYRSRAPMYAGQQAVAFALASAYIGVWWLAIRVMFGRRFGLLVWVPVGMAAVAVPAALAGCASGADAQLPAWLFAVWFAVPVAVDLAWLLSRMRHWLRRCPGPDDEVPNCPAGGAAGWHAFGGPSRALGISGQHGESMLTPGAATCFRGVGPEFKDPMSDPRKHATQPMVRSR